MNRTHWETTPFRVLKFRIGQRQIVLCFWMTWISTGANVSQTKEWHTFSNFRHCLLGWRGEHNCSRTKRFVLKIHVSRKGRWKRISLIVAETVALIGSFSAWDLRIKVYDCFSDLSKASLSDLYDLHEGVLFQEEFLDCESGGALYISGLLEEVNAHFARRNVRHGDASLRPCRNMAERLSQTRGGALSEMLFAD